MGEARPRRCVGHHVVAPGPGVGRTYVLGVGEATLTCQAGASGVLGLWRSEEPGALGPGVLEF